MSLGLKTVASDVLGQLGTLAEIRMITRTEDRDAGTSTEAIATIEARGAPDRFRQELIDGTRVKTGDLMFTVSAADVPTEPKADNTRVRLLDKTYEVVGVDPVPDGDEVAAWTMHLRLA